MAITEVSGSDLDDYLDMPDCPQCGSDDVVCTQSYPNGLGGTVKVYLCNRCGHIWTETVS